MASGVGLHFWRCFFPPPFGRPLRGVGRRVVRVGGSEGCVGVGLGVRQSPEPRCRRLAQRTGWIRDGERGRHGKVVGGPARIRQARGERGGVGLERRPSTHRRERRRRAAGGRGSGAHRRGTRDFVVVAAPRRARGHAAQQAAPQRLLDVAARNSAQLCPSLELGCVYVAARTVHSRIASAASPSSGDTTAPRAEPTLNSAFMSPATTTCVEINQ